MSNRLAVKKESIVFWSDLLQTLMASSQPSGMHGELKANPFPIRILERKLL